MEIEAACTIAPHRSADFWKDLDRDRNRLDQILDDPLGLLKASLAQTLRACDPDTVRKHDGSKFLNIIRQAIGPPTNERQGFGSPTQRQRSSRAHPQGQQFRLPGALDNGEEIVRNAFLHENAIDLVLE